MAPEPRPTAEALFARYHAALFRFFRRMTGRPDRADELAQEVFVRVVQALPRYEARGQDAAWLFQIARHLLDDDRRMAHRRAALAGDAAGPTSVPPRQDLHVALDRALADVAMPDRAIFLLREIGGFGYAEIAATYGLTPDAVRNRIRRTRQQLQQALAGELRHLRDSGHEHHHD